MLFHSATRSRMGESSTMVIARHTWSSPIRSNPSAAMGARTPISSPSGRVGWTAVMSDRAGQQSSDRRLIGLGHELQVLGQLAGAHPRRLGQNPRPEHRRSDD